MIDGRCCAPALRCKVAHNAICLPQLRFLTRSHLNGATQTLPSNFPRLPRTSGNSRGSPFFCQGDFFLPSSKHRQKERVLLFLRHFLMCCHLLREIQTTFEQRPDPLAAACYQRAPLLNYKYSADTSSHGRVNQL